MTRWRQGDVVEWAGPLWVVLDVHPNANPPLLRVRPLGGPYGQEEERTSLQARRLTPAELRRLRQRLQAQVFDLEDLAQRGRKP